MRREIFIIYLGERRGKLCILIYLGRLLHDPLSVRALWRMRSENITQNGVISYMFEKTQHVRDFCNNLQIECV